MKNLDLLGRIRRTIQSKIRHYNIDKMQTIDPLKFYDNPKKHLGMVYAAIYGRYPNFRHPEDINQQLMAFSLEALNDPIQHQLRVQCADKYRVRDYVKSKGLEDILIPSYGEFDSFDEIDFDNLPNQFVVQYNFGCGQIWICRDKQSEDIEKWRKQFHEWNKVQNEGLDTGEWHYAEIPHKIIVTKYLDSLGAISVNDYKFQCFNGQVYGCFAAYDRMVGVYHGVQFDHYDIDWKLTDGILPSYHPKRREIPKPKHYQRMLEVCRILSKDFPYVRVDLYEADDKVYFGELTFTPQANIMNYYHDDMLVDMLVFYKKTLMKN